jgi:uncharacterized protein (DUF58 family)
LIKVRRNFWVVIILLIISLVAAVVTGTQIYYRLVYLWGLLIGTGWIWTFFSLRSVMVRRHTRTLRQQVGQIFEERFEISNLSGIPRLWLALRDDGLIPGAAGSRVMSWIGAHQQRTYLSYTWLTRRGLFQLGPTVLESGDLFGLFTSRKEIPPEGALLVTPFLVDLQSFLTPSGVLSGGRVVRGRTQEVTPYAAGVREYVPGDSLNRIHWPTTARRDKLMVKEFEQDPQADVWIFVDAQASVHAAIEEAVSALQGDRLWVWRNRPDEVTLPASTIEYGVSVAASVARYYIQQGRAVGLTSLGQMHVFLSAERGERQLGKIMDTLAFIQPEGDLPLLGLITAQAGHLPRGCTVVIITPSTQQGVLLAADDLEQRNLHPVIILLDAGSFGGENGTAGIANSLTEKRFPVKVVANGADIRLALELSATPAPSKNWWAPGP